MSFSVCRDGLDGAGEFPACLLHGEIGFADGDQCIVGRRLAVRLPGSNLLPGGERSEDGVGHADDGGVADAAAATHHQTAVAVVEDGVRHVLNRAGMVQVIRAESDAWEAKAPGPAPGRRPPPVSFRRRQRHPRPGRSPVARRSAG